MGLDFTYKGEKNNNINPFCIKSSTGVHQWIPLFGIFEGNPELDRLVYHTEYRWCCSCKAICDKNDIVHLK